MAAGRGRGLQTRSDSPCPRTASLWFHGGGHCWCAPPPCQMEERIIQPLSLLARKLSERLVWCWVLLVWRIEGEFSPHSEYSVLPVTHCEQPPWHLVHQLKPHDRATTRQVRTKSPPHGSQPSFSSVWGHLTLFHTTSPSPLTSCDTGPPLRSSHQLRLGASTAA